MSYYQKKYTLEFDDVIEGEFNDYRLEIFKKSIYINFILIIFNNPPL